MNYFRLTVFADGGPPYQPRYRIAKPFTVALMDVCQLHECHIPLYKAFVPGDVSVGIQALASAVDEPGGFA